MIDDDALPPGIAGTSHSDYHLYWEALFLQDTQRYYLNYCLDYWSKHSFHGFLAQAQAILTFEDSMSSLGLSSHPLQNKHLQAILTSLYPPDSESLRAHLLDCCLDPKRTVEFAEFYQLFALIHQLDALAPIFAHAVSAYFIALFTESSGLDIQSISPSASAMTSTSALHLSALDPSNSTPAFSISTYGPAFCARFLKLYYRLHDLITHSWAADIRFYRCLDKSSRHFLNDNEIHRFSDLTAPEFAALAVAKLCDDCISQEDVDLGRMGLQGVQLLYALLSAKDIFCRSYKIFLSARLMRTRAVNRSAEDQVHLMLVSSNDVTLSDELNMMCRDVELSLQKFSPDAPFWDDVTMAVRCEPLVLSSAVWAIPTYSYHLTLIMPDPIETLSQSFVHRYEHLHSGRTVQWLHDFSVGILELRHPRSPQHAYLITLNHFQLAICLLLHQTSMMSREQLAHALDINFSWLDITLKSLLSTRIIQFHPSHLRYRLNPNFQASRKMLNASLPKYFKKPSDAVVADPQFEEHRSSLTQMAIVRIMKTRKQLSHNELCEETIRQTSTYFPQTIERIKRQIEKLLNGSPRYLERIDAKMYRYIVSE